ncbi:hypothetical protein CTA2_297, partial [Colletotrichum tanaceti]
RTHGLDRFKPKWVPVGFFKSTDERDQEQRHQHHDALLGRPRRRDGPGLRGRQAGQVPHRHLDGALCPAPGRVRRRGRQQPLWRHPLGSGPGLHGHHRHRAVGQPQPGRQVPQPVRAGPRQRARHCRPGRRQPRGDDLGRADAVPALWVRGGRGSPARGHRERPCAVRGDRLDAGHERVRHHGGVWQGDCVGDCRRGREEV